MSANLMASLLLSSHAMPNRAPQVAHSETSASGGGFDSMLADFDQQGATLSATEGAAGAGVSPSRAPSSQGPESPPTTSPAKLTTNVDAALSLLGTVPFIARPAPITPSPSTKPLGVSAEPRFPNSVSPVAAAPPSASSARPTASADPALASSPRLAETNSAPASTANFAEIAAALDAPSSTAAAWPSGSTANGKVANLGPAAAPVAPTPGAALGSIAYSQTTPLAFAPELGFQSLQTKTYLAVSNIENAARARLQGQTQGQGAAEAAVTKAAPLLGPAAAPVTPTPGAALGAIAYAQTTPLAFAPELGFQSLQTKTYLAVSNIENAAPASLQGQTKGQVAVEAVVTNAAPLLSPAAARVTPTPAAALGPIAYAQTTAPAFAPELGFQSLQAKTNPAVSNIENAAPAVLQGQTQVQVAVEAAVTNAAPRAQASPRNETAVSRKAAASADLPAQTFAEAAVSPLAVTASAPPRAQANPQYQQSSSRNSGHEEVGPLGPQAGAVKTPAPSPAVTVAVPASPTSASGNIVNLSDLGDQLVNAAQSLGPPDVATHAPLAAGPLKQLQLNLAPAHLGAVAVTLKMTNGKLSVDVGVANPNALAEVESQRDSIVAKLQVGAQPLESFVVHQQNFSQAPPAQTSSNATQNGSFGSASGNDKSSQDAQGRAPGQPRTHTTPSVAPARNSQRSDLVV